MVIVVYWFTAVFSMVIVVEGALYLHLPEDNHPTTTVLHPFMFIGSLQYIQGHGCLLLVNSNPGNILPALGVIAPP